MVARTLVTTADERTWPKDKNEPILFLGEWCKYYNRKDKWGRLEVLTAPYHWDDRKKLFVDYQHLQVIYEELLVEMSTQLNQLHSVDHSLRYWRILIGPWLGYFIQILFDRWSMLEHVIKEYEISKCYIIDRKLTSVVPNNMSHFTKLMVSDDWNEAIYSELLRNCWRSQIELISVYPERLKKVDHIVAEHQLKNSLKLRLNNFSKSSISLFNKIFTNEDSYFFISSYLPLKSDLKLQFILGQFPKIWRGYSPPVTRSEESSRDWNLDANKKEGQSFDAVVRKIIVKQIPSLYLEGYEALVKTTQRLAWPKRPKLIYTSNSYSSDDVFKCWAAEKTEAGVALVIGQHGGHFGMNPFSFHEEHQIEIADKWLSWGWSDCKRSKIHPVCNLKVVGHTQDYNPVGGALMVEMTIPRYSYHLYAAPISTQWLDYLDDQHSFLRALPKDLRKRVLLRLSPHDYGWSQVDRWKDQMPEIQLNDGHDNIYSLIKNSRLYIATYNATTYLESLSWNIPTIMFWNPTHWELNEKAKPYFELLKAAGILHETPESAALQMIMIWDSVESWWESDKVQSARKQFIDQYSQTPENYFEKLQVFFEEAVDHAPAGQKI